jgi:hypothetical protein
VSAIVTWFVRGFIAPSAFALWLMLATFLATGATILTIFSPQFLAGPIGTYLPRSSKDTEAFATREALKLAVNQSEAGRIVVIGDSIVAHAFADEAALAEAMRLETGNAWDAHMLTNAMQTPLDEVAFVETAIAHQGAVIVLGLDWGRLGWIAEQIIDLESQGRIGLRSDWADTEFVLLGGTPAPRYGIYTFDNFNFFLNRAHTFMLRFLTLKPAIREIANYRSPALNTPGWLEEQRVTLVSELRKEVTDDVIALDILTRLAERLAKRKDVFLVFVSNPLNTSLLSEPGLEEIYREKFERLVAFAKTHGDAYCQLPIMLLEEEFYDYIHLDQPEAQAEQRNALARCLGKVLKEQT